MGRHFRLCFSKDLNDRELESLSRRIFELDSRAYPVELRDSDSMSLIRRVKWVPDSVIYVEEVGTGELVGYTCLLLICKEAYERAREGYLLDTNITKNDLALGKRRTEEPIHLLVISVVVAEEFRGSAVAKLLGKGFSGYIKDSRERGFDLRSAFGFAVSKGGSKWAELSGFREVWDNGTYSFVELEIEGGL